MNMLCCLCRKEFPHPIEYYYSMYRGMESCIPCFEKIKQYSTNELLNDWELRPIPPEPWTCEKCKTLDEVEGFELEGFGWFCRPHYEQLIKLIEDYIA